MKYMVEFTKPGSYGKVSSRTFESESARDTFIKKLKADGGKVKATTRKP